jgi:aspartyl-tRNA(Asn)/glutamyl-tRNA(Gln) amidotransferase subunit A
MSLIQQSATELLALLEGREVSSRELTAAFLDQIEFRDGAVRAFLRSDRDAALAAAEQIDRRRSAGEDVGRLGGLPLAVKDVLCTRDQETSCASKMLEHYRPPYDATVVARLKAAGAVILGKTNMDEFAMGGSCENSAFHPTCNPWDLERIPGGSSGGAAACVAASMAPLSVGSDTGGSIRQPAAHCGVVGLKPTYGRVSRYGLVAFASSLDAVGPLARTVEDAALLLEVIAGHDGRDATSLERAVPDYSAAAARPLKNLRLGVVEEHFGEGLDAELADKVRAAIELFCSLGASVEQVTLPHSQYAIATYYIIAPSEASSNLARYDGAHYGLRVEADHEGAAGSDPGPLIRMYRATRAAGFGTEVKRRIMLGTYALSAGYYDAYYLKALRVRRMIADDYQQAFEKVDLLIGPVTPTPAFMLGEKIADPLSMYLVDLFTVGANLAGIPAISLPCGFSDDGLPVGLHLQGPALAEAQLLQAAAAYQRATEWHKRRPQLAAGPAAG